ncbi:MAG: hydantoinase B/oxoprolinase family protein [Candidatus Tectomicrobia bacterium]|uniref:Hydantoinase B/oxoprolinase family protein n=1 Tax=Tectimicrobiota bacterium TaxID=2528274 RepID=A0A933GLN5_UNCTE|nr:hydantoinase B/oxoprolinase family protein [Candidatus Tectomicrobia bacterium]
MAAVEGIDVVTRELINNAISSVVDEMALAMQKASYSPLIRDLFDFSTTINDSEGNVLGQGLTNPFGICIKYFVEALKKNWGDDIQPGDIFIGNDPYEGASHIPDVYICRPIFLHNELAAFVTAEAHQLDMGGRVAGSNACDNVDIYQEGLRMAPLKFYELGLPNYTLHRIIEKNVRVSHKVLGDLESMVAATAVGERRFLELVEKYNWPTLHKYLNSLLDYSEEMTRAAISALPDGVYDFEDFMDDDGFCDDPVRIYLKLTVKGDSMTFDFTGSSPAVKGSINNPYTSTVMMVHCGVRAILEPWVPANAGVWRPITLIAPEHTIVNAGFPEGVAGRGVTMGRIWDTISGALAKAAPDRIPACCTFLDFGICMGGLGRDGKPFVFTDFLIGSWGGRPWADGITAQTSYVMNYSNVPCEVMEREYPLRMEHYTFVPDTGGPGKYRGGLAYIKDYRIQVDNVTVQWRQDREKFPPWGCQGGKNGTKTVAYLITAKGEKRRLKKSIFTVNRGDLLVAILPGAGGWGNPFERDIDKVVNDVRNELVSVESAERDYGVVIDPETFEVNTEETNKLRESALAHIHAT